MAGLRTLGLPALLCVVAPFVHADSLNKDQVLEAEKIMAEKAYRKSADLLLKVLVGKGLSESDAQAVLRKMFVAQAACISAALEYQSHAQSIPFHLLLQKFSTGLRGAENLQKTQRFDFLAFDVRAKPCMNTAASEAGLSAR